jgi:hypothetical protein
VVAKPLTLQAPEKGFVDTFLNIKQENNLFQSDVKQQLQRAKNTPNTLSLGSFREREASIEYNLLRLSKDPTYQALSPDAKVMTRAIMYQKLVVPTFKQAGVNLPDFATWLRGTVDVSHLNPEQQFRDRWGDLAGQSVGKSVGGLTDLVLAGVKFTHKAFMDNWFLGYGYAPKADKDINDAMWQGFKQYGDHVFDWAENKLQHGNDISEVWQQTHPAQSVFNDLTGATASVVAQMPLYEVLGAAAKLGAEGTIGRTVIGRNMTEALMATKKGQWLASGMRGAAEGYMMGTIRQKSGKQLDQEAGMWALQNMAFSGVPLGARAFLGKMAAVGGKVLLGNMFDAAMTDAFDGHLGIKIQPDFGEVPKVAGHDWTPTWSKDYKGVQASREMGGKVEVRPGRQVKIGPQSQSGNIIHEGVKYPYSNHQQMQEIFDKLATAAHDARGKADPVLHETNAAMEEVIQETVRRETGFSNLKELAANAPGRIKDVVAKVWQGIFKATDEAPVHAQEHVEQEAKAVIDQAASGDPEVASMVQRMQKAGIEPSKAVAKNVAANVARRTGLKNVDEDIEKLKKITIPSRARKGDASASYSMEEALGKEGVAALKKQRLDTHETLRNSINQGIAYFRNPGKKGFKMGSSDRAADGTRIGMRNKDTFHERLAKETTEEFIRTLEIADGRTDADGKIIEGSINFQDPTARILFHWGNRKQFGSKDPFVTKMQRELEKAYNDPKNNIKYTRADFDRASDNLARHLIYLAKSASVNEHGGITEVFRSSNFFDEPTVWQVELNDDVDMVEMNLMEHVLANQPKVLEMMQAGMDSLQNKRRNAYEVKDWLRYNNMINTLMAGEITPEIQAEL